MLPDILTSPSRGESTIVSISSALQQLNNIIQSDFFALDLYLDRNTSAGALGSLPHENSVTWN